jgi:flagellum-specific peptidoglycan hydrolase FlgJ
MTKQELFISQVGPGCIKAQQENGLPACVMIAQFALETGWGQYTTKDKHTKKDSFNLGNIKWRTGDPWAYVIANTKEYLNGKWTTVEAKFRAYPSFADAAEDYARFLAQNKRYAQALQFKHDPDRFVDELAKAGYATDPDYAKKIKNIMKSNQLKERFPCA